MNHDVRNLPLSQDLLNYYRERLERCEHDYKEALDKIDALRIPHDDAHRVTWEAHKKAEEVASLQKALRDAELALFDEKRAFLKLLAENDELKVQELKDRKKIRYLLKIAPCPEPETTYFREKLDKRLVKISRGKEKPVEGRDKGEGIGVGNLDQRDMIIMEDEIEALKLTVTSLRTQLEEQGRAYEATVAALKRDRQTQIDEEKARREHESQRISELLEKLQKLRALCRENIRELLHTKKASHAYEKKLVEEKAALLEDLRSTGSQLAVERDKAESAERTIESRVTKKQETLVGDLRSQLGKYEKELHTAKSKCDEIERTFKKKVEYLQSRLSAITSSYTALKRRRDYEIEGFTNDILILRKQLKVLERSILKYAPLEDKELVLLNLAKETGERVGKISSELHGLKAKVYATEEEVRSLKY
ncbi:uncharacterized protein SPPG_09420 [Spizellomyces punctatus DAOM BR117]|uniref:Coiled-coil domain-containing protein 77 n=1 Tax=Spizellomyces punctatus (strain DAOM BR117) TaxID=645134 RepID=A0A0L0HAI1_SPIPD|nr:uncharacterized protein SPPG_09420 [Spizellomyces punctatus DAOM BR117]KNC97914.1 hypothetical protein SPPG_09420 [Spizellomyces punctatus DAOM BR117]|eukprot:XP_016605954.1 hypothetical protein SPPG_09420 [Spizellomyces punctatus DAOM BR117]